ncbi:MAG TPA: DUF488 family protein [Vicinamibacterales bacterium]|jgi:uncharacterized protein YeaO (DUF488 family)
MALRVVRLGSPRHPDEGLRLGTVRRPPRGVKKENYARESYFDLWLPDLAPSAELFSWIHSKTGSGAAADTLPRQVWSTFSKRYEREMRAPQAQRLLALLASLSKQTNISVGCYCEDESQCHRSVLKRLLEAEGAVLATDEKRSNTP